MVVVVAHLIRLYGSSSSSKISNQHSKVKPTNQALDLKHGG